jgi:uncharacterized membrane protein YqjE
MSEPTEADGPAAPAGDPSAAGAPAGKIGDDAQAVIDAARAAAGSYFGGFDALRRLFAAEVGLARDALVRALVYLLVATVMLGTAYLLLTALLVAGLRSAGAPWPLAIGVPLLVSVLVAAFGIVRARSMLHHADFEATRRQLSHGFRIGRAPDAPP